MIRGIALRIRTASRTCVRCCVGRMKRWDRFALIEAAEAAPVSAVGHRVISAGARADFGQNPSYAAKSKANGRECVIGLSVPTFSPRTPIHGLRMIWPCTLPFVEQLESR